MMRRGLVGLLAAAGLLLAGGASAANEPLSPYHSTLQLERWNSAGKVQPIPTRVAEGVEKGWEIVKYSGSTPGKIVGEATLNLPKAGSFVKWGGGVVIGATVLQAAMEWAYQNGQHMNDQKLKDWWQTTKPVNYPDPPLWLNDHHLNGSPEVCKGDGPSSATGNFFVRARYINDYGNVIAGVYFDSAPRSGWKDYSPAMLSSSCLPLTVQNLEQFLRANPGSASSLADTLSNYVRTHPEDIHPSLTPAPTLNQWEDNPYADPTGDIDKDGVPDYLEFEDQQNGGEGDPNDPNKKPKGAPYETGRTTTTKRNPDGSLTTTTTVTYSNGKEAVTSVTRKTEVSYNPDTKTKTTTTTTTTETTSTEGEKSSKTHTEKKEEPYDPDNPDDKKDECTAGGGSWDSASSACTPGDTPEDKKANCEASGGSWTGTSCTPAPKPDDKKDKCEAAGRAWDDVNGTCGADKKEEDKKKEQCTAAGRVWDDVNSTCGGDSEDKKKDDCQKKGGEWDDKEGKCGAKKEDPPSDTCGDFGMKRLMAYPGSWFKDVVFPCDPLDWDKFKHLVDDKFPFCVVNAMQQYKETGGGSGGGSGALPDHIGPFSIDLSFASGFLLFIKAAFRCVIWWLFGVWLVGRFSGQVVLS